MKKMSIKDIKQEIAKRFDDKRGGYSMDRPLFVYKSYCAYHRLGCVFFALNGSPPKGYAIWVPDHRYLLIVDAFGKTTRMTCDSHTDGIEVVGLDDVHDFEILEKDDYRFKEEYIKRMLKD